MVRKGGFGEKLREGLVVSGLTMAVLLLAFLQLALPYWFGPAGLVLIGLLDAAIYLEFRRRRAKRRRVRASTRAVGRSAANHKGPLKDEFVATAALLVLALGLSIEGMAVQGIHGSLPYLILFQGGAALTLIACLMLWPYEWRFYDWRAESDKYDTTDDH